MTIISDEIDNLEYLTIWNDGGSGSKGQDGGDGASYTGCHLWCARNGVGGDGGNGGTGGHKGAKGRINIINSELNKYRGYQ